MTRTKLMLTGLVAGTLALTTGCASQMANRGTGGAGGALPGQENTTGIYDGYAVPQEDRASTGGSGYEDAVTNPAASGTSQDRVKTDIRDQDPMNEPGTGGSGYDQDSKMFQQSEELGGSRFPGDKAIPQ